MGLNEEWVFRVSLILLTLTWVAQGQLQCSDQMLPYAREEIQRVEAFAQAHGFQPLESHHRLLLPEKDVVGSYALVLDATEPQAGSPGRMRITRGFVDRLAHHFVVDIDEPRLPRHDGLVLVDEEGRRTLLDNSDAADRVFVYPQERTSIQDTSKIPLEELLKQPGWVQITPKNAHEILAQGLAGKEIAGYQTLQGGRRSGPLKYEVRGIIRSEVPFTKFNEWMRGLRFSTVTGTEPYTAVEIINAQGTTYDHPLSAPGKYWVRDLNPEKP